MTVHKFYFGQSVEYLGKYALRGPYVVTAKLPERDGELGYHIRHPTEPHERTATESDLTAIAVKANAPAAKAEAVIRKLRFGESVRPRTVRLGEHKTSFRLEDEFWTAVEEIAFVRGISISKLVANIIMRRRHANLSSMIRLYVLNHYRRLAEQKATR